MSEWQPIETAPRNEFLHTHAHPVAPTSGVRFLGYGTAQVWLDGRLIASGNGEVVCAFCGQPLFAATREQLRAKPKARRRKP